MKIKVNQGTSQVVSVGIQGPMGADGITSISQANDVDMSTLTDGSVLVYETNSSKWVATTRLEKQTVDCGQF